MVKGKFSFEIIYRQYTVLYLTFVTTTKQGICPPQAMPLPIGTKLTGDARLEFLRNENGARGPVGYQPTRTKLHIERCVFPVDSRSCLLMLDMSLCFVNLRTL